MFQKTGIGSIDKKQELKMVLKNKERDEAFLLEYLIQKGKKGFDFVKKIQYITFVPGMVNEKYFIGDDVDLLKQTDIANILKDAVSFYPVDLYGYTLERLFEIDKPYSGNIDMCVFIDYGFINYVIGTIYEMNKDTEAAYEYLDKYILPYLEDVFEDNSSRYTEYVRSQIIGVLTDPRLETRLTTFVDRNNYEIGLVGLRVLLVNIITYGYNRMIKGYHDLDVIDKACSILNAINRIETKESFIDNLGLLLGDITSDRDPLFLDRVYKTIKRCSYMCDNQSYGFKKDANRLEHLERTDVEVHVGKHIRKALNKKSLIGVECDDENTMAAYSEARSIDLYMESLGLDVLNSEDKMTPRKIMLAFINNEKKLEKYYSEFFGMTIGRNDQERINAVSRKIDSVLVLFEFMSNEWEKKNAMNKAYDVLGYLDDQYNKVKNADSTKILDALRSSLNREISTARAKDIKKMRMTVKVDYPDGYKG